MWIYQNEILEEIPEGYLGFVYLITNKLDGRLYVGKKLFNSTSRKKVKDKVRRKKVVKESNWKEYYGSSEYLKLDIEKHGVENFNREILHLCKTKAECNYKESYEIFIRHALLNENYYNSWVSCRINKNQVLNKFNY